MEKEPRVDAKYVQQHLANERTFLAWIRTSITIVGLGFLAAGVVFRSTPYTRLTNTVAAFVGIGSVFLGSLVFAFATKNYYANRRAINNETFRSPNGIVLLIFVSLMLINSFLMSIVAILLLY
ncbi:YidH family protein [Effusibacillus consociatus]|uniref:YidH family protein n=1 Tax=Effusibacillus consociatus TaxID=1117041 RepID=A0ABV9Q4V5_9BACL